MYSLIILDSDQLHPDHFHDQKCIYALWSSSSCDLAASNIVNIPLLIEEYDVYLRSKYLSFVHEFGETAGHNRLSIVNELTQKNGLSYWWLTLIAEKSNLGKSFEITNIIKFYALEHYLKKNKLQISRVCACTSNKLLRKAIIHWAHLNKFEYFNHRLNKLFIKSSLSYKDAFKMLPQVLQAILYYFHFFYARRSFLFKSSLPFSTNRQHVTFFSYFCNLDPSSLSSGKFNSSFWSELPNQLNAFGKYSLWFHFFVQTPITRTPLEAFRLIESLNRNNSLQTHFLIDQFISFPLVIQSLVNWIQLWILYLRIRPNLRNARKLYPVELCLLSTDIRRSFFGITSFQNLLYQNIFLKIASLFSTETLLFYLQENQAWEVCLLHAFNKQINCTKVGVAHSTVRFWDLRYHYDPRYFAQVNSQPLYEYSAVNGVYAQETMKSSGHPTESLILLEALRYDYIPSLFQTSEQCSYSANPPVLILGDYSKDVTESQLSMLECAFKNLSSEFSFVFRGHPLCPINLSDYPSLPIVDANGSLPMTLSGSNVILSSCSTSASVDAYSLGKLVIVITDPKTLNLSPLKGCKDVFFVSNSSELALVLENIHQHSTEYPPSEYFNLNSMNPSWHRFINLYC